MADLAPTTTWASPRSPCAIHLTFHHWISLSEEWQPLSPKRAIKRSVI